jgi:hypothetical protein
MVFAGHTQDSDRGFEPQAIVQMALRVMYRRSWPLPSSTGLVIRRWSAYMKLQKVTETCVNLHHAYSIHHSLLSSNGRAIGADVSLRRFHNEGTASELVPVCRR